MLAVKLIRLDFLKTSARVLNVCKRNIGGKKKPFWGSQDNLTAGHIKTIQDSYLTPQGFEVIYASPLYHMLKFNYSFLPVLWTFVAFDTYLFCKDEKYLENLKKNFVALSATEKMLQLFAVMGLMIIALHIIPTKVVVATFRKGNELQSMFCGFFGFANRTYVPHGYQAFEPTPSPSMYRFKGQSVVLFSFGFKDVESYQAVVKYDMP